MIAFLIGLGVGLYASVAAYIIVTDWPLKAWHWAVVIFWPVVLAVSPLTRWAYNRWHYVYRDDPKWGKGWYKR